MIELKGTLKERLDEAIRLANAGVTEEEIRLFRENYQKAGVKLLPSAEAFFIKYGGVFKYHYMVLTDARYNGEIEFWCYAVLLDFYYTEEFSYKRQEKNVMYALDCAMDEIEKIRAFAGQEVCPIADIGYYYPAVVYIGENGLLYCTYEWTDEIRVFHKPAEIFVDYLLSNVPIGLEKLPVK